MKILRLGPGKGRTFVCGDIHGAYSCVQRFLELIGFNFENDRLICAGDLIDRGPDNESCIKLLDEPWFFCCMGNHEHMMYHFATGQPYGMYWSGNGGDWGTRYFKFWTSEDDYGRTTIVRNLGDVSEDEEMMALVQRVCKEKIPNLPYLITVEKNTGGVFHVLHAELPPKGEITDEMLADEDKFLKLATVQSVDGDYVTWGRWAFAGLFHMTLDEREIKKYGKMLKMEHKRYKHLMSPDLSPIYSGHTIIKRPVQIFKQTNLDTKAYGSYQVTKKHGIQHPDSWCGLTVTEPETGKFWFVNDREFKEVEPIVFD